MSQISCTQCDQPLVEHCPPTNPTCTWLRCKNTSCPAAVYDWHRGSLRYEDGTVEIWDDQPTTDQPPSITIEDNTDGGTATPDA